MPMTMDRSEALRSIQHDHLEYIQQKVRVDFDNRQQRPVSFTLAGQIHRVCEVVDQFRLLVDQPVNGYLVQVAGQGVFFLYYQLQKVQRQAHIDQGFWVLGFRILNDHELMKWYQEDRRMLANISMKRVVDFHGHICPELAIGGKFCEFAQNLINTGSLEAAGLSVVSENTTSALDAIQVLLGLTIGNQRLLVLDYGKHNYTLFSKYRDQGWKLIMRPQHYGDEDAYLTLERKIMNNEALYEDALQFQQMVDMRISHLIDLAPEDLFSIEEVAAESRPKEISGVYLTCATCGEQVLETRSIENRDKIFCLPCFQKKTPGCMMHGMQ